ncbi:MAG: hypothetical protein J7621_08490 [Niastella sp.]|nr:hypothetical protein [Niastella sp.]
MNDKAYTITVAEPWDFESPDGKNVIQGTILSILTNQFLVFKANYILNFDGVTGDTLLLTPRFKEGSFNSTKGVSVNGGMLLIGYEDSLSESELKSNSKFVLIGTIDG